MSCSLIFVVLLCHKRIIRYSNLFHLSDKSPEIIQCRESPHTQNLIIWLDFIFFWVFWSLHDATTFSWLDLMKIVYCDNRKLRGKKNIPWHTKNYFPIFKFLLFFRFLSWGMSKSTKDGRRPGKKSKQWTLQGRQFHFSHTLDRDREP